MRPSTRRRTLDDLPQIAGHDPHEQETDIDRSARTRVSRKRSVPPNLVVLPVTRPRSSRVFLDPANTNLSIPKLTLSGKSILSSPPPPSRVDSPLPNLGGALHPKSLHPYRFVAAIAMMTAPGLGAPRLFTALDPHGAAAQESSSEPELYDLGELRAEAVLYRNV